MCGQLLILGFSLRVTYTSRCVDALIGGNGVASNHRRSPKGHCLLRREHINAQHLTVCLFVLSSLFVKDNAPDIMCINSICICMARRWGGGSGDVSRHSPP